LVISPVVGQPAAAPILRGQNYKRMGAQKNSSGADAGWLSARGPSRAAKRGEAHLLEMAHHFSLFFWV